MLCCKLIKVEVRKKKMIGWFMLMNQMRTILQNDAPCRGKVFGPKQGEQGEGAKDLSLRSRVPPRAFSPNSCPFFESGQGSCAFWSLVSLTKTRGGTERIILYLSHWISAKSFVNCKELYTSKEFNSTNVYWVTIVYNAQQGNICLSSRNWKSIRERIKCIKEEMCGRQS